MADFAVWATAAEEALGWEPGAFMEAYSGNRAEATESALEADPIAIAVREFMEDRDEWTGTAGELWEALNELVGEGIKHTKAWPGAPNALSVRMKRLAPALRGIGIEYSEDRSGSKGSRLKTLTKKEPAEDRQRCQYRQSPGEDLQNGRNRTDDADDTIDNADDAFEQDRQRESAANHGISDDADGSDDGLRPDSKQRGTWATDPLRHYSRGGAA